MCYVGGGVVSVSRHPSTSLLLDSGQQLPKSALLNSFVKVPFISDGIKKNICQAFISLEQTSRNSKLVQYLERKLPSLDATRLCVSYAEAKLGRLFFKPITVPGRIWISWKGTQLYKHLNCKQKDRLEDVGSTKNAGRKLINAKMLGSTFIQPKTNAVFRREFCTGIQRFKF
eukprot:scaffold949_cov186-Alexandrium_tamarense.AAC.13